MIIFSTIVLVAVSIAVQRTRIGKATRAVADNPALSSSSGINVDRVISVVWSVGAGLAGLSGVLLGMTQGFDYQVGFKILLLVFAAVVLGGLGSVWGATRRLVHHRHLHRGVHAVHPRGAQVRGCARRPHRRAARATAGSARARRAGRLRRGDMDWGSIIAQSLQQGLGPTAVVYALAAIGLNVTFGYTGLLNFGQAGFMAIGGYAMASFVATWDQPFWLAIVAGLFFTVILALILGIPTLRLRADYLAIVTIAASEIIRQTIGSVTLLKYFGGQDGVINFENTFADMNPFSGRIDLGVTAWRAYDFWLLLLGWILVAVGCLVVWLLMRSPWGRVMKGVREDEDAVRSLGKNVYMYKMQSLVIGGVFGAFAGFFVALQKTVMNPTWVATDVTFFAYTVLLLGGAARVLGPVAGSIIFWFLITFLDLLFDAWTSGPDPFIPTWLMDSSQASLMRLIVMGLALMLLMIFRPQGIFGDRRELAIDAR